MILRRFTWRRAAAFFCLGLCLGAAIDIIVRHYVG